MKKILLILLVIGSCIKAYANLDTVTVVSHQDIVIKTNPSIGETFYPQWAEFPTATDQYRKVLIQLKFECAPGLQCGEWDYVNNIIIGKTGGVNGAGLNYEIARLITPQGFYWNASSGWNHTWYYDVTDFAMLLHDSVEVIYRHSGYENNTDRGWKINLKFICIKGTPVAEPVKLEQLWSGSYTVGDATDSIEHHLVPVSTAIDPQASFVRFKGIHIGLGSDENGCMEYCRKYRNLTWDGNLINQKNIWRSDCANNSVYPQSGTWTFNRAGWCPGSVVMYDDNNITGISGGTNHTVDMDLESYYNTSAYHGTLNTTAYLIQYKSATNNIDAAVDNILAPSTETEFSRLNPICSHPIVVIRNNGSAKLTSATIEYGVYGGVMTTQQWSGGLDLMQTDTVTLTSPVLWSSNNGKFIVTIKNPNGQTDQFTDDNSMISDFTPPLVWPNKIAVAVMTNKDASENYYQLLNLTTGQTVYSKKSFKNETLYTDTIALTPGNCYRFYFSDEDSSSFGNHQNKDGLELGAYVGNPNYEGAGTLKIRNGNTGSMLKDATLITGGPFGTKGADFGANYVINFMCGFGLGTKEMKVVKSGIELYPNPSAANLYIDYTTAVSDANVYLYDMQGKLVIVKTVNNSVGTLCIDISSLTPSIYTLKFVAGDETIVRKVVKK